MKYTNILNGIETILFDLGGVILNIDFQKPVDEFKKIGVDDFASLYSKAAQNNLFNKLETGKIKDEEFYNEIRGTTGLNISDEQIENAWNSIILDFPKERIEIVESLKKEYRVILLSNTNNIHYRYYNNYFKENFGYQSLDSLFHKTYFSQRVGLRKPDREIYEHVLLDSQLVPEKTLFVEDTAANLIEPKKLNIRTLLLENDMCIEKIFA